MGNGFLKRMIPLLIAVLLLFTPVLSLAKEGDEGTAVKKEKNIIRIIEQEKQRIEKEKTRDLLARQKAEAKNSVQQLKKLKAGEDYVADEALVSVSDKKEAQAVAKKYGAALKSYSDGLAVLKLQKGGAMEAIEKSARPDNDLPPLQPNFISRTCENDAQYTPSDPKFKYQYCHTDMSNKSAWDITKGKDDVIVAVIDTGIDIDHPEFKGRISSKSYNSYTDKVGKSHVNDDYGHGTHVAGIIAAAQNNGKGGCGTAPRVTILAIKANTSGTGGFNNDSLCRAIRYAAKKGADVINLSLGRPYSGGPNDAEHEAIQYAQGKGALVVCAAGNDGQNHAHYPAAYEECVAVSAMREGRYFDSSYSNYGPEVDIAAPGTDVYSTYPDKTYGYMSGTSMATPQVCGAAALVRSKKPTISVSNLKKALYNSATDRGSAGRDDKYGYGAVNSRKALTIKYYTVKFNTRGGTSVPPVVAGSGNKIGKPTDPQRTGYRFAGWYKNSSCTKAWKFSTDKVTKNITLYAKWTEYGGFTQLNLSSDAGQLNSPYGVATDTSGYLYVTDFGNDRVLKFTPAGKLLAKWGVTGSGNGQLNGPSGIATDAQNNVYVVDYYNHRVQKFSQYGAYLGQWGGYGSGNGQFSYPEYIAVDAAGNVYVDDGNERVQKFNGSGGYLSQFGGYGSGNGQFVWPSGIALDGAGCIYVADSYNGRIQKFNASGAYVAQWGGSDPGGADGKFWYAEGLEALPCGQIVAVDYGNHRVQKFTTSGAFVAKDGSYGSGMNQFYHPVDVTKDFAGNLYVTDTGNNRIMKKCNLGAPKYKVTFNSMGGSSVSTQTVRCLNPATSKTPTRKGYKFGGWFREAACVNQWNFSVHMVTSNITLYAKWVPVAKYTVKASANNSTYGSVSGAGKYLIGTQVSLTAKPKSGCRFVKWMEGSTKKSTSYRFTFTLKKNRTFKAYFTRIAKTSLNSAYASGSCAIKLKWSSVSGAAGYNVYSSTKSGSGFSYIGTTASTSFTNAGLIAGKKYYYKVRAYCLAGSVKTYGAYSSVKYAVAKP